MCVRCVCAGAWCVAGHICSEMRERSTGLGGALALLVNALPSTPQLPMEVLALRPPIPPPAPVPTVVIDPVDAPSFGPSLASPPRRPRPYPASGELPLEPTVAELDAELSSAIHFDESPTDTAGYTHCGYTRFCDAFGDPASCYASAPSASLIRPAN